MYQTCYSMNLENTKGHTHSYENSETKSRLLIAMARDGGKHGKRLLTGKVFFLDWWKFLELDNDDDIGCKT